jgi:hypothetical protein
MSPYGISICTSHIRGRPKFLTYLLAANPHIYKAQLVEHRTKSRIVAFSSCYQHWLVTACLRLVNPRFYQNSRLYDNVYT